MIEAQNGQSHVNQSKTIGRFTGERLLRERPRVYRRVVELLEEPGMSINQITKLCWVSEHTVPAPSEIAKQLSIAERKQRLISIFANVAETAAERMEELAGTASLRDAGTTAGIATGKLLALSTDPSFQANQHSTYTSSQITYSNSLMIWSPRLAPPTLRPCLLNRIPKPHHP